MTAQQIVFRTDASLDIGTGHVMRCLTLADVLRAGGANCRFISREHPGNLLDQIRRRGFEAHGLPTEHAGNAPADLSSLPLPSHSAWLGTDWATDAKQTLLTFGDAPIDWLIVDHYALDASWESALKPHARKLMVIDDLADRAHDCDLLLDQTLGRNPADYKPLVPNSCTLLCGSQYALLRPEFSALRTYSLKRRVNPRIEHLLITMGGVDKGNATGQILEAIKSSELPAHCRITVVMGPTAPWLAEVRQHAEQMPWPTEVRVNIGNMAQLMADSDLAIGAAGATSWERCCLGLPTLMVVLADNQREAAFYLEGAQAALTLDIGKGLQSRLFNQIKTVINSIAIQINMIRQASSITDGLGSQRVLSCLSNNTVLIGNKEWG